jgi:CRISPR system Cascade subunit CasE
MSELYLSRLRLEPRRFEVQRALADSQAMHTLLLTAFPATPAASPREALGILFRVEIEQASGVPVVLVQSAVQPDWRPLADVFRTGARPQVKETSGAYAAIGPGARLRFRLRANPTRRVPANRPGDKLAGKRVNLWRDEDRIAWIGRKLQDAGCELEARELHGQEELTCTIRAEQTQRGAREGRRLSHGAVVFDGILRVDDANALRAAIRTGIGAGKAYGFGLLSVAPVRE